MALGEFSLIDQQPRSATAYAETEVDARKLTLSAFEKLIQDHPHLGNSMLRFISKQVIQKMRIANAQLKDFMIVEKAPDWVDTIVKKSTTAQAHCAAYPEEMVDTILSAIVEVMDKNAEKLAEMTVKESGFGVVEHKTEKIRFAAKGTYNLMAGKKGSGFLSINKEKKVTEMAAPIGVILGLIPLTNPVPTLIFKTLICLKSRNSLILSCHRNALGVGNYAGELIRTVLKDTGADPDLLLWIKERGSRKITSMFMTHPGVKLILATGGPGMVKAAYTSGKPAIGVGCGNAPVWICPDADLDKTADIIIKSKSFDNGVICGSENNLVVDKSVYDNFCKALENNGAYIIQEDQFDHFSGTLIDRETGHLKRELVGQSAKTILQKADIQCDDTVKLIVVPVDTSLSTSPWGSEMLAPVISMFTVKGEKEGIQFCKKLLDNMGAGHTAIIHTNNNELVGKFGWIMPVSRVLNNCGGSTGCIGIGNGLRPSFTLGCGTWGNTSTTDNVSYDNLINIKRIAAAL
jgi:acyl-CoA reductase-like NAD-dependent aldehyde dehydrogenase